MGDDSGCDFDGDGYDDLATGAPGEAIGSVDQAGAVNVIYGTPAGLDASRNQAWHQGSPGIRGRVEPPVRPSNGSLPDPFPVPVTLVGEKFGHAIACGDFDGDGHDDLAVGVPGESIGAVPLAGAVNVIYGTSSGLTQARNQAWHQNSPGIAEVAEEEDSFGSALAVGDFDGDGHDDLAVSAVLDGPGGLWSAGAVNVIYGSGSGLTAEGNQLWHQDTPGVAGRAGDGDLFGKALAVGDFDGDGHDDLAVTARPGVVHVFSGSAGGLSTDGSQTLPRAVPGIVAGIYFGDVLAGGDFNGDGYDDLATSSCCETGALIYGSATGLTTDGNQRLGEAGALAAGDFDGDGHDDLAAGCCLSTQDPVLVNAGSPSGLDLEPDESQSWSQASPGIHGVVEPGDQFGRAVASGDFNGDGHDDLAVGVPGEDLGDIAAAGAINVIYGTDTGLAAAGDQAWAQSSAGIRGAAEAGDLFGGVLTSSRWLNMGGENCDAPIGALGLQIWCGG